MSAGGEQISLFVFFFEEYLPIMTTKFGCFEILNTKDEGFKKIQHGCDPRVIKNFPC